MANLIQLRRSVTAGHMPPSLNSGEIAINEADGILFFRGSDGSVKSISLLLASVALGGVSTAPTAAPGTNTTQIASTAFVQSAVNALVAAAPGTLDTLKELADAIGDDPNFAVTMTAALGNRVRFDATQALNAAQMRQAQTNMGAQKLHGIGQCYLNLSGGSAGNLVLKPEGGNLIWINGALETIPDAGVTLAPTGNAANTLYYIYAYMSGSTMMLEYSTTAYAIQNGTGIRIKNGDGTRTLVGIWSSYTSAATWTTYNTEGVSYFNPKRKTYANANLVSVSTVSTSFVEMASAPFRTKFISFADREVTYDMFGTANQTVNTASANFDLSFNGSAFLFTTIQGRCIYSQPSGAVGNYDWFYNRLSTTYGLTTPEVKNYATGVYCTSAGTLLYSGAWSVTVLG